MTNALQKTNSEPPKENRSRKIIRSCINFAGHAAGGIAATIVTNTIGDSYMGSAIAYGISGTVTDVVSRHLSVTERTRITTVAEIANSLINKRLDEGETQRSDGFFQETKNGGYVGEEVMDDILNKCRNESQTKKLPHIGACVAELCFNSSINIEFAHQLIKAIDGLSYRQLCLLKIFATKDRYNLRKNTYNLKTLNIPRNVMELLDECHGLYNAGYIVMADLDSSGNPSGYYAAMNAIDYRPSLVTLYGIGEDIFSVFNLSIIPDEELLDIVQLLSLQDKNSG